MIEFYEHKLKTSNINLTPMIDVVFLLLIFFLLTSVFSKPSVTVSLAKAETGKNTNLLVPTIYIKNDGTVIMDGEKRGLSEINEILRSYKNSGKNILKIEADRSVAFENVVGVIDVAKKVGVENISIVTERKK